MGKPVKIHKKKSFMFTTKHTSFLSVLGIVILAITITVMAMAFGYSFNEQGNVEISFGGIGLSSLLLNIIGLIAGISGLNERDTYKSPSFVAIIGNSVVIIFWVFILVLGNR